MRKNAFVCAAFVIVSEAAGSIGSVVTVPKIPTWYADLQKPALAPPNGVFGPVWTTLFLLMGIAAFLVWKERRMVSVRIPLTLFYIQLALNVAWSFIFFGLEAPGAALIEIAVLWVAIACTFISFWRVSRTAGLLLVPYLAWVSFAAYLTYSIWALN